MDYENGNHSGNAVARAAAILIEACDGAPDIAITRAERQLETSLVKPFAAAVLEEVKRLCADQGRKH